MPKSTQKLNKYVKSRKEKTVKIYMDYAASSFPNPNSVHEEGVKARRILEDSREKVSKILGTQKSSVVFTSGATESNNLAIQGIVFYYWENFKNIPHIITTNIEHPSVLETFLLLEKRKLAKISIIKVEKNGIVDIKKIKKEIKKNTILISVMYVNNEIGTIEPIKEIVKEARFYRKNNSSVFPFVHTDATQAINYLDINVERLGIDLMSFSGSKIERASSVGILYKRKNVPLVNVFGGGEQEFGLRPGTENLSAIRKFVYALELVNKNKQKETKRILELKNYFIKKLPKDFILNGDREMRIPNNINITYPNIPSDIIVIELSSYGIMISSKSACKSKQEGGSYVVNAINPQIDKSIGGLRFSFGSNTKKEDIDYTIKILSKILIKYRKWYN